MIIKIIPENDIERANIQAVEHTGIKEFFIFGNKKDREGDVVDFHDWRGSYRYLEGSIYYFLDVISEERKFKSTNMEREIDLRPQAKAKTPLIKRSGPEDGKINQIISAQDITAQIENAEKQNGQIIDFPNRMDPIPDEFIEEKPDEKEEKNGAEDI